MQEINRMTGYSYSGNRLQAFYRVANLHCHFIKLIHSDSYLIMCCCFSLPFHLKSNHIQSLSVEASLCGANSFFPINVFFVVALLNTFFGFL